MRQIVFVLLVLAEATATAGTPLVNQTEQRGVRQAAVARPVYDSAPALAGWPVDVLAGVQKLRAAGGTGKTGAKAATDPVTIFRPLSPCRLVDTRVGQNAPIGPPAFPIFSPGQRRTVHPNGACGIPSSFVAGLSVTAITNNHTPNSGGVLSLARPLAPLDGVADIFNIGSIWASTAYNVPTDPDGSFDISVSGANADVIIDINGYYQDLDNVDIASTEIDILGNSSGDVFEVFQSGTGSALAATSVGGPALTLYGGSLRVAGAGPNTVTPAFTHVTSVGTVCPGTPQLSVINNLMTNGQSLALLFITPRTSGSAGPFRTEFGSCGSAASSWAIRDLSGPISGEFNVLVIKP